MPSKTKQKVARPQSVRLYREVQPVMEPLLELFSVVDEVFATEGAFSLAHIKKSLGRIHRAWKKCRSALDPDFDPKRYPKKPRPIRKGLSTAARVPDSSRSSSGTTLISEKSQKKNAERVKKSPKKSASHARSKRSA